MKSICLALVSLLFINYSSFCQSGTKPIGFGVGYSTEEFLNLNGVFGFSLSSDKPLLLGFETGFTLKETGKGRDYSSTLSRHRYPNEIYSIEAHKMDALSILGGTMLTKNFGLLGKIGHGSSGVFYNAFDNSYILSNTGFYFIRESLPSTFIYGIDGLLMFKSVFCIFGWDNFTGASVGVGASL